MTNYPLTVSQQAIYLNHEQFAGQPLYTLHALLTIEDPLEKELLIQSVTHVLQEADAFSLTFSIHDGEPTFSFKKSNPAACTYYKGSSHDVEQLLEKRRRQYLPLSGILYDVMLLQDDTPGFKISLLVHHLLVDGFSIALITQRILETYQYLSGAGEKPAPLEPFENHMQIRPYTHEDQEFWHHYFSGISPDSSPVSRPAQCFLASRHKEELDPLYSRQIDNYAHSIGVTPYAVFAAALAWYHSCSTQSNETVLLLPRLNRPTESVRNCIGCFVQTVALRVHPCDSFKELCQSIYNEGKETAKHQNYGTSNILTEFFRSGESPALPPYTLNYQKGKFDSSIPTSMQFSSCGAMENMVTINIFDWNDQGNYTIWYDYREDMLTSTQLLFFHQSLHRIMEQGMQNTPLDAILVVADEEQNYLRKVMQGKELFQDSSQTIVSLWNDCAAATPDDLAVVCEKELTYRQLDLLSNRLANALLNLKLPKGLVAFSLKRSTSMYACILGILKAGYAFLPLDIRNSEEERTFILQDSQAVFMINDANINSLLEFDNEEMPAVLLQGSDLAYCIYTSGTTGHSKGVLLEHKGIVNITNKCSNPFNEDFLNKGHGLLAVGSITFDIALFEFFVPILNHHFVVLAKDEALTDAVALSEFLRKYPVDAMHCTPSRLSAYLNVEEFQKEAHRLRFVLSAGEVLPQELVHQLDKEYGIAVYNGYGPTEATIGASVSEANDCHSIGKPISNTRILILSKDHRLLPMGYLGEIGISGVGLAKEYLNRPKDNEKHFITMEGQKIYLTGDYGYWDKTERLCYSGRMDQQIKLRGLRIELAHIEARLMSCSGVTNCAVLVHKNHGSDHLAAFYSSKQEIDAQMLKQQLSKNLLYYMVPEVFIWMKELPATPNGKIDKKLLLQHEIIYDTVYEAPTNQTESLLCSAFAHVLGIEQIGINHNFFEYGGTSLLAAKLLTETRKEGLIPEYADIFAHPTPALLAQQLQNRHRMCFDHEMSALCWDGIDDLLTRNEIHSHTEQRELHNVLLTGATGYLGCHILAELLKDPTVHKIWCLLRPGKKAGLIRLRAKLFYYFDDIDMDTIMDRIVVLEGDITDAAVSSQLHGQIQTVINSAANVSHFAYGDVLRETNIGGVKKLLAFCEREQAMIVQISTISVGGFHRKSKILDEQHLWIHQSIFNEYTYTKFAAEQLVLAAGAGGLTVKIMRVGNLQGRRSDGEFQMNLGQNAFASHLRCYVQLGCAPLSLKEQSVNFSPVDDTAAAIVLLSKTPEEQCMFHVISSETLAYERLINKLSAVIERPVEWISDESFQLLVEQCARDDVNYHKVDSLLVEQADIHLKDVGIDSTFTVTLLKQLHFTYGTLDDGYLQRYAEALHTLDFFD